MKNVLNEVISSTYGAFVPRRLIIDNVIVAHGAMHSMNKRMKGKTCYMALKLNMTKAYDIME